MSVDVTYAHLSFMPFCRPEATFCCEVLLILIIGPTDTQCKGLEDNVIKVTLISGASRQSFSSHSGTNQDHCIMNGNSFTNQAFSSNGGLRLLHYLVLSAISPTSKHQPDYSLSLGVSLAKHEWTSLHSNSTSRTAQTSASSLNLVHLDWASLTAVFHVLLCLITPEMRLMAHIKEPCQNNLFHLNCDNNTSLTQSRVREKNHWWRVSNTLWQTSPSIRSFTHSDDLRTKNLKYTQNNNEKIDSGRGEGYNSV